MSILSFPDRGKWGSSKWRGNCSGHVYKDLFERLKPTVFVDPMVGSGTSVEVAHDMGIEAYGLDLHSGFNALRDSIVRAVGKAWSKPWSRNRSGSCSSATRAKCSDRSSSSTTR